MTIERIVPNSDVSVAWQVFGGAVHWQNVDEDIDSPVTSNRNFSNTNGQIDRLGLTAPVGVETAVRIRVGAHGLRINASAPEVIVRLYYSGGQIGTFKLLPDFPVTPSWGTVWTNWWTGLSLTPAEIGTLEVEYEKDGPITQAIATLSVEVDFVDPACTTTTTAAPTTSTTAPPTTTTPAPTTSTQAPTTTTSITHFTTTTEPPGRTIFPNADLSPNNWSQFGTCLFSAKWDCINNGIATPDDAGGIVGIDDTQRFGFENPNFVGTSAGIRVKIRAAHSQGADLVIKLYDGAVLLDSVSFDPDTPSNGNTFENFQFDFSIAKTAAELADFEIELLATSGSFDHWVTELEVFIALTAGELTTTTTTSTTVPPECLELDEFNDASIAAFWNQDKGDNPGATFTEVGGQVKFDSGPGVPKLVDSLWHPAQAGGDANITWLNQEIDALQIFGHQCLRTLDVKIPLVKKPAGFGSEGDTIGLICLEDDDHYAAICKTIRGGQQFITAVHMRDTTVRRVEIPHTRWPIYFRIVSHFGGDTGLGDYMLKTQYSHTGFGAWTDLFPKFGKFNPQHYRGAIGNQPSFKIGMFAHHGETWPATTTTVTDPPGLGSWLDKTEGYWEDIGFNPRPWVWDPDEQAYISDQPNQTWAPLKHSDDVFPGWRVNFRPTHARIAWDSGKQSLSIKLEVEDQLGGTLGEVLTPNKSPLVIPLTFGAEDIWTIAFRDADPESHDHYAVTKVEFWKACTTTTTSTTTSTGPFDGGALCRNKWNSGDVWNLTIENNDYRARHANPDNRAAVRGFGQSSGKLYFEIKATNIGTQHYRGGVATAAHDLVNVWFGDDAEGWCYICEAGRKKHNGVQSGIIGPTLADNDVLNVAVDLDAGKIWFGVNNLWIESGKPHLGLNPAYTDTDLATKTIYPCLSIFNQTEHGELFSQEGLTYAPPGGFDPWCSELVTTTTTTTTVGPTTTTT